MVCLSSVGSTRRELAKFVVVVSTLAFWGGGGVSAFATFGLPSGRAAEAGANDRISDSSAMPTCLQASDTDVCTIQILMSDTGGGHRASANALRDAFDVLHPGKIHCDIVDIYTEYGPVWPYNDAVPMYKLMAANPWMWATFYAFGCTDFGLCVNEFLLENICFDAFSVCLSRPSASTGRRADMVVSVHPLTQGLPLKVLATLDSTGDEVGRKTPFCTVVTDLGSGHPTWFNPG